MTQVIEKFKMRPWQEAIANVVSEAYNAYDSEAMQRLDPYSRNKDHRTQISLGRNPGHTTLAAYFGVQYPSVLIYTDVAHYKTLEHIARSVPRECEDRFYAEDSYFHIQASFISNYNIYHDLMVPSKSEEQAAALSNLALKFEQGLPLGGEASKLTIVDQASTINLAVLDWLYQISTGPVVLLG